MKKLLLSLSFLFAAFSAQAQCDGFRYYDEVFPGVTKTADVLYGTNVTYTGQTQNLLLDVYQPTGDNYAYRPLIVWAHGGSFVGGTKGDADIVSLCNHFAKRGYVCVSMEYRLGVNGTDSIEMTKAVMRAVHDMRAAVRFMKQSASTYAIDTSAVYVGGSSAGAFTALHHAYLDRTSKMPGYVQTIMNNMGGMEGTSNNIAISSKAQGVINLCGALSEKEWISSDDEPLVSLHGTADQTVPYGAAIIYVFNIFPVKVVDGSGSIHPYALAQGIPSTLKTFYGAGHVPYLGTSASALAYMDTTVQYVRDFLYEKVCGTTSANEALRNMFKVYPNPVRDLVKVSTTLETAEVSLFDVAGKKVATQTISKGENEISTTHLHSGIYFLHFQSGNKIYTHKISVIQP